MSSSGSAPFPRNSSSRVFSIFGGLGDAFAAGGGFSAFGSRYSPTLLRLRPWIVLDRQPDLAVAIDAILRLERDRLTWSEFSPVAIRKASIFQKLFGVNVR